VLFRLPQELMRARHAGSRFASQPRAGRVQIAALDDIEQLPGPHVNDRGRPLLLTPPSSLDEQLRTEHLTLTLTLTYPGAEAGTPNAAVASEASSIESARRRHLKHLPSELFIHQCRRGLS
jgi:hypothetical protein